MVSRRREPVEISLRRIVQRQASVRYSLLNPLAQIGQVPVHGFVGVQPRASGRGRFARKLLVHQNGAWLHIYRGRGCGRALLLLMLDVKVLKQHLAVLPVHVDQHVHLGLDVFHLNTDSKHW